MNVNAIILITTMECVMKNGFQIKGNQFLFRNVCIFSICFQDRERDRGYRMDRWSSLTCRFIFHMPVTFRGNPGQKQGIRNQVMSPMWVAEAFQPSPAVSLGCPLAGKCHWDQNQEKDSRTQLWDFQDAAFNLMLPVLWHS